VKVVAGKLLVLHILNCRFNGLGSTSVPAAGIRKAKAYFEIWHLI
jgi:hypothetical protein